MLLLIVNEPSDTTAQRPLLTNPESPIPTPGRSAARPISYGIINKHHGRIDVESTPGQGASFRIVLPIRQPK
ncbi:hypothetical protein [Xanthomonas arboricola]